MLLKILNVQRLHDAAIPFYSQIQTAEITNVVINQYSPCNALTYYAGKHVDVHSRMWFRNLRVRIKYGVLH